MTLTLNKSEVDALPFDFEQAVKEFIVAKEQHRFMGDAAPVAPLIVERAVKRVQYPIDLNKPDDFIADYVIIDDTPIVEPPAPPTFAEKKAALVDRLHAAEVAKIDALMTRGKHRLLVLKASIALAKSDMSRSAQDRADIDALTRHNDAVRAIQMESAEIEAAIDDLTGDMIDTYELPGL